MQNTSAKPHINRRQQSLLAHIRSNGRGDVESLSRWFKVTPQTIRRDLNTLGQLRLVIRVHGGAIAPGGVSRSEQLVNLDYSTRSMLSQEAKEAIGARVAQIIPNDASMFINIGTTTESVARHLTNHIGLFTITNNINIANTLRMSDAIKVMTAGGLVRHEDGGIVGDATEEFINRFKVDYAVISCSALEADGTMLDFDTREVKVTQAIIRNARSVILACDSTKFDRKAPVRLGNIDMVNYVVLDESPPGEFKDICLQLGVQLIALDKEARSHGH